MTRNEGETETDTSLDAAFLLELSLGSTKKARLRRRRQHPDRIGPADGVSRLLRSLTSHRIRDPSSRHRPGISSSSFEVQEKEAKRELEI